jgi:hypothetical protein
MALVSCDEGDVELGTAVPLGDASAPPPAYPCPPKPSTLAWVSGLKSKLLALDADNVYVVASQAGDDRHEVVVQVPKAAAGYRVVADAQDPVADLDTAWDAESAKVFWTTQSAAPGGSGAVWKFEEADGGATILTSQRTAPGALIPWQDRVYWAEQQTDSSGTTVGAIVWTAASGAEPVSLLLTTDAGHTPRQFDVGGPSNQTLFWTTADVAATDNASAEVLAAPLEPTSPCTTDTIPSPAYGAGAIETACDGSLYLSGRDGIYRYDATGLERVVSTSGFVQRIEDGSDCLLYVDPAARVLRAAPIDPAGGSPWDLASDVDPASAFDTDGQCVYWVDAAAQAVKMVRW